MGTGDIAGVAALILSALALWLSWRSEAANRRLRDELMELYRRESRRVDALIEHLIAQRERDS